VINVFVIKFILVPRQLCYISTNYWPGRSIHNINKRMQSTLIPATRPNKKLIFHIFKVKYRRIGHRFTWCKIHDDYLRELALKHGEKHWDKIGKEMQEAFADITINGKKCRERWANACKSGINRLSLSEEEDLKLILYHQVYSNKWALIAKHMPERNSSSLKNCFYSLARKAVRKIELHSKGEQLEEGTPLQFYTVLYLIKILRPAIESQAHDNIKFNQVPPHIIEYMDRCKITVSMCSIFIERLKEQAFVVSPNFSKEALATLKKTGIEALLIMLPELTISIEHFMTLFPPNAAICSAIEKVLLPLPETLSRSPLTINVPSPSPYIQPTPYCLVPMAIPYFVQPSLIRSFPICLSQASFGQNTL